MEEVRFDVTARDGTRLSVEGIKVDGDGPVVLVLHGIMSHRGWYRWVADALADHGVSCYLADRRGIGASGGVRGHASSWRVLADDVAALVDSVSTRHGGADVHILGMSLGATIAMSANVVHGDIFSSLVAFSPGLGTTVRVPLARKLHMVMHAFLRPHVLHELPFGINELTDNAHLRRLFGEDPHRTSHVTARFLLETLKMQRSVIRHTPALTVPVYALLAGEDAIVDNDITVRSLARLESRHVRVEVFDKASHCLPGVVPRSEVTSRILRWLQAFPDVGEPGLTVEHTAVPPSWRTKGSAVAGAA